MAPTYRPTDVGPFLKAIQRPKSLLDTYQQGMDRATKRDYNELVLDERKRDFENEQKLDDIYASVGESTAGQGYSDFNKKLATELGKAGLYKEMAKVRKEGMELEEKALEKKAKMLRLMYRGGKEAEAIRLRDEQGIPVAFDDLDDVTNIGNKRVRITPSGKTTVLYEAPPNQKGEFSKSKVLVHPKTKMSTTVYNDEQKKFAEQSGFLVSDPNKYTGLKSVPIDKLISSYQNNMKRKEQEQQVRQQQQNMKNVESEYGKENLQDFMGGATPNPLEMLMQKYPVKKTPDGRIIYKDEQGKTRVYGE